MSVTLALLACLATPQSDLIVDWFRLYGESDSQLDRVTSALAMDNGDVIVTGSAFASTVARLDSTGATVWEIDLPTPPPVFVAGTASDGAGGFVLMGSQQNTKTCHAYRFDGQGNLLWSTELPPSTTGTFAGTFFHDAVGDGAGGMVGVGGEFVVGTGLLGTIFRVDANGQEVARVAPFGTEVTELFAIDRGPGGEYGIATTYRSLVAGVQTNRTEVALFDADLNLQWRRPYPMLAQASTMRSIGFGGAGGLYVGTNGRNTPGSSPLALIQRLNPVDGSTLWERELAADEDASRVLEFAPLDGGGVAASGSASSGPGTMGLVQRVSEDGELGPPRLFGDDSVNGELVRFDGVERRGDGLVAFGVGLSDDFDLPGQPTRAGLVLTLLPEPGETYCGPAVTNSLGLSASITAHGSDSASSPGLVLRAQALPANAAALFIVGSEQGSTPILGNGQGIICLGGSLGRYTGQLGFARPDGVREIIIDPAATPTPAGPAAIAAGQTWNFQCWYRDTNPTPTSNATDAVSVTFE